MPTSGRATLKTGCKFVTWKSSSNPAPVARSTITRALQPVSPITICAALDGARGASLGCIGARPAARHRRRFRLLGPNLAARCTNIEPVLLLTSVAKRLVIVKKWSSKRNYLWEAETPYLPLGGLHAIPIFMRHFLQTFLPAPASNQKGRACAPHTTRMISAYCEQPVAISDACLNTRHNVEQERGNTCHALIRR